MTGCESNERSLCECHKLNSLNINTIVQCRACTTCVAGSSNGCNNESRKNLQKPIQARIQNQVGVTESQLLSVNSAFTISFNKENELGNDKFPVNRRDSRIFGNKLNLRNQSDRTFPSRSTGTRGLNNVPTRGSSTSTSITRNRPGAMAPGGVGVDVKHGSYARYLAKIKASNIVGPKNTKHGPFDKSDVNNSVNRLAKQNAGLEARLRPAVNNKQFRFSFGFTNEECFKC
jgi:hypothetical protein